MQLRPEIQIKSMLKAMVEVVCPAIDPRNPLAVEQAGFVVGLLRLLEEQLPLLCRYDREELERLVQEASTLSALNMNDDSASEAFRILRSSVADAEQVLTRCAGDPSELTEAVRQVRGNLSNLVTATSASGDSNAKDAVTRVVFRITSEQLVRERSMLKSQGWEKDPAAVPELKDLLATRSTT